MRYFHVRVIVFLAVLFSLNGIKSYAQQFAAHSTPAILSAANNYTSFTQEKRLITDEVTANNKGYEQHPELGLLYNGAPCSNCFEILDKRTENTKTFKNTGNSNEVMMQTGSGPLHYKGANGEWLTIKSKLRPDNAKVGVYAASEQPAPISIDIQNKYSSIGTDAKSFQFNKQLELIYVKADGTEEILGGADYSHYTAGDDGVYITNAWPGIDVEMLVIRGAIKTNFLINHAMPAYAGGSLHVRDHFQLSEGLWLNVHDEDKKHHRGDMFVVRKGGAHVYEISAAVAFEKAEGRSTLKLLEYQVEGNVVDIVVPGNFLNRAASSYPVVIDPLVSFATSSTITGSKYSPTWTSGCTYNNAATVPARVTVTDVQFTFQYVASGGALTNNGAYDFRLGTCRSPAPSTLFWNCSSGLPGTCDAVGATIFAGQIEPCIPPPICANYDLNVIFEFYQNYASSSGCSPTYISAGTPLTITVFGRTVEATTIGATSTSICQGQSTTLSAATLYGVPPYTYSWAPGGGTGATFTVSPTTTTTYTLTVSDACGNVASGTKIINVNPVYAITGQTTICSGGSSTLSCTPGGGSWSSNNLSVATVGASSGIVTGGSLGTAIISYTSPMGCISTTPVNVILPVAAISGYMIVCQGSTTTLSDVTPGGTWSSSNIAIGTVGAGSGVAAGIGAGTSTISYSTTAGAGCVATAVLTVNPLAPITGTANICVGGITNLSDLVLGGTWSSSNSLVASVGASTGVVSGVSAGTATITYTTPTGCRATMPIVVNLLSPISGTTSICQGNTSLLSNLASGGSWSSSAPSVASIGSTTGLVSGNASGIATITYTIPAGCTTTTNVTINPIGPITGSPNLCVGGTSVLSNVGGPGTWTSSNPSVATVGGSSGVATGVSVGTATISYVSAAGCTANIAVNVGLPTPITGTTNVCQGSNTTLFNSTTGGTWTSANPSLASVGASTGVVSGVSGGTVAISYTNPSGCTVSTPVTVNSNPPIGGATMLCVGAGSTLTSTAGGGTWVSSAPGIAAIGASSGVLSGVAAGGAGITYTTPAGCVNSTTVTVNVPSPITGVPSACQGNTTTLSNTTPGGVWSSSNPLVATIVSTTGLVTGIGGGTTTVSYSSAGGCVATQIVTINPISPVTGAGTICEGDVITLSDATPGGSWTSSAPSVATVASSGSVTGVGAGSASIIYTTVAGCTASASVGVNPAPAPITGGTLVCVTTTLSDAVPGGTWSSSNPTIAVVGPTGLVTGVGPGVVTITYTLTGGCSETVLVTVNPLTTISGVPNVCQGSTTTLTYPQPGGTWTSLNPAIAVVGSNTGIVTGVTPGSVIVKYTTSTGCVASVMVTVFPILPIAGVPVVCQGSTTTLSDPTAGGTWSTADPSIATVGASTGFVTGTGAGTVLIQYTTSSGCAAGVVVTVNPLAPITGTPVVCESYTSALNDLTPGGTWSSVSPGVASVDPSTGLATGVAAGTTTIRYTTTAGCVANMLFTVNAQPSAIGGSATVCQGNTTTLTNTVPGGTWTSSNPAIVNVTGSLTGTISGVNPGTADITYTTTGGCSATRTETVYPLSPITGPANVCVGSNITLNDATAGGAWSSSLTGIATIDPTTGVVTGISAGVATISYTTSLGCVATFTENVHPLPSAIGGIPKVCIGSTTVLTNTLSGGAWSTANPAVATVASGIVAGITADTVSITYATTSGCFVRILVTVNPLPLAITGVTSICQGETSLLSDATAGGTWSSSASTIAPVGASSGIVSGLAPGTANIKYTTPEGCFALTPFVVNPLPTAITGTMVVCEGANTTLHNSLPGGLWMSAAPAIATIGASTGVLVGIAAGNAVITYVTAAGCLVTTTVTVNPTPVLSGSNFTNPTTCVTSDGTITLSGLVAGQTYTINYTFGSTPVTVVIRAGVTGSITITGLAIGTYTNFTVTNLWGCTSAALAGPIMLVNPAPPAVPVAGSNSPLCDGAELDLTATDATSGVTYSWSGPVGFTSTQQYPLIYPVHLNNAGTYSVTATKLGCISAPATVVVVVHPIPAITKISAIDPTTCQGANGTITLEGLLAGVSYNVQYSFNGNPVSVTMVADGTGKIVITGLAQGSYTNISATSFTCPSNTVGPVTLTDPNPPPAPKLTSNSPLCSGKTLRFDATDAITDLTYEWTGPNGFTSDLRNPLIDAVTMADSGLYTLVIRHLNCPASASVNVIVYPPLTLTNVTASQVIPIGSSVTLSADGATFYLWSPFDGSLDNTNIKNPVATPMLTTTYMVQGMNEWGCADSAEVTITVDQIVNENMPNTFTPNGDGLNDIFKIENIKFDKLVEFSVFNRWGQMVYHNSSDATKGWDGTFNGQQCDMGVYNYSIILAEPTGKNKYFKGTVSLVR